MNRRSFLAATLACVAIPSRAIDVYLAESGRILDGIKSNMIVVGDHLNNDPTFRTTDVVIRNCVIDGKQSQFAEECCFNNSNNGIRFNGITIRGAENVIIENCKIFNCRSGGIVIERGCKNITIRNCEVYGNFYDGIAAYDSQHCTISGNTIYDHKDHAGLSFDLQFNNNSILSNTIFGNNLGVFMRWCDDNTFKDNVFNNAEYDLYFNQIDHITNTMPKRTRLINNRAPKQMHGGLLSSGRR